MFSIVIPTFRRTATLLAVLEALGRQEDPPEFEVVVVDDGSGDDTLECLAAFRSPYPFRHFSQENAGPASARNRGVREARGEIVAFLGDDTVPERSFLAVHAGAHAEAAPDPIAVLGYTTWPRELPVSSFLHHINEYGLQFGYGLIEDRENVPFNFFYTSNVSLPRALLLQAGLFDTSFPHAAWEDIEVAYRLMRGGMRMVYRPEAVARHHHAVTFASFRRRQEKAGEAAAIFYRKHPELSGFLAVPQALRLPERPGLWLRVLPAWAALSERRRLPAGRWAVDRVLRDDYLRGLRRGLGESDAIPSR
jgi:glycosyltransferase involved in cell wall biosynthesis